MVHINVTKGRTSLSQTKLVFLILISSLLLLYSSLHLYSNWAYSYSVSRKQYGVNSVLFSIISPPGVIVKPIYGLGNQLFRYSCSYALSKKLHVPLYLQIEAEVAQRILMNGADHSREEEVRNYKRRPFLLDHFPSVPLDHLITPDTNINGPSSSTITFKDDFLLSLDGRNHSVYSDKLLIHDDYCQSETFFSPYQKEIKKLFQPDIKRLSAAGINWKSHIEDTIKNGKIPVAVHVRRGDYVSMGGKFWVTPITFDLEAVKTMRELCVGDLLEFFVFSDDIQNVKESLRLHLTHTEFRPLFVSGGLDATSSLDDFILMTLFSHLVISNSTYSWWAAYLSSSPNKTVIAPTFHPNFFDHYESKNERDFKKRVVETLRYPPKWIVFNPYVANASAL